MVVIRKMVTNKMTSDKRKYSDRKDYQKNYQQKWREDNKQDIRVYTNKRARDRKKLLIAYAGGCCVKCGYNKCYRALHFHHVNPNEKEYKSLHGLKLEIALKEIKKCILVCSNCHMEIHEELENN